MLIEGVVLFQSFGYYGGELGNVLSRWQQLGVFSYLLPFLLIFAVIFGILSKIDLFKGNKGVNSILSLAVALMALQFDLVTVFFSDIFPRLGLGLVVILSILILTGLFIDWKNRGIVWGLFFVALVVVVIVISKSLGSLGLNFSSWIIFDWREAIPYLILLGLGLVVLVSSMKKSKKGLSDIDPPIRQDALGTKKSPYNPRKGDPQKGDF